MQSNNLVELADTSLEPLLHNLCNRLGYRLVNFRIDLIGTLRATLAADD